MFISFCNIGIDGICLYFKVKFTLCQVGRIKTHFPGVIIEMAIHLGKNMVYTKIKI